jgi:hypothetical protein
MTNLSKPTAVLGQLEQRLLENLESSLVAELEKNTSSESLYLTDTDREFLAGLDALPPAGTPIH